MKIPFPNTKSIVQHFQFSQKNKKPEKRFEKTNVQVESNRRKYNLMYGVDRVLGRTASLTKGDEQRYKFIQRNNYNHQILRLKKSLDREFLIKENSEQFSQPRKIPKISAIIIQKDFNLRSERVNVGKRKVIWFIIPSLQRSQRILFLLVYMS